MRSRLALPVLLIASLIATVGCGNSNTSENAADNGTTASNKKPGLMERLSSKPVTVPAGTILTVRLGESLSTKSNKAGDTFTRITIIVAGFWILLLMAQVRVMNSTAAQEEQAPFSTNTK